MCPSWYVSHLLALVQGNTVLFCLARTTIFPAFQAKLVATVDSGKMIKSIKLSTLPRVRRGTVCQPCWHGALLPLSPSLWQAHCTLLLPQVPARKCAHSSVWSAAALTRPAGISLLHQNVATRWQNNPTSF